MTWIEIDNALLHGATLILQDKVDGKTWCFIKPINELSERIRHKQFLKEFAADNLRLICEEQTNGFWHREYERITP